jgi:hypothetical protein
VTKGGSPCENALSVYLDRVSHVRQRIRRAANASTLSVPVTCHFHSSRQIACNHLTFFLLTSHAVRLSLTCFISYVKSSLELNSCACSISRRFQFAGSVPNRDHQQSAVKFDITLLQLSDQSISVSRAD